VRLEKRRAVFNFSILAFTAISVWSSVEAAPAVRSKHSQPEGEPQQSVREMDELKAEITRLGGRVEDMERTQKDRCVKAGSVSKDELKKLELRLAQAEQANVSLLETFKKLQESTETKDPNELFKKAKSQFDEQNYEGAAELLGLALKSTKFKSPQDATLLRGECYSRLKQHKKAIVEYSKFSEKFSRSPRAPEALYKIGLSFDALGMKEEAKGFYQELVEKYPKSPEAKKIKKPKKVRKKTK